MFNKGDYVFHKREGMLFVEDVFTMEFNGQEKYYYNLKPVYSSKTSTLMLPVELDFVLRVPMTKEEAEEIISKLKDLDTIWTNDNKQRRELYNSIFSEGSILEVASIAHSILLKKKEYIALKKALPLSDTQACELSKRLINEEIAFALGMEYSKVEEYITNIIES